MNKSLKSETTLRKEWRLFKEGFVRLVNAYLNMMFDLSPKASSGRFWAFVILFFVSGFLLSLINYPLTLWLARVQDVFLYFINSAYRAGYTAGDPISNLILFALQVFFDPRNLRFVPLLLAPYFIALQSAAIYLADVFNLDDVSIARRHILEVALGGSDETIHIAKGEITDEDKKSANYLIGGPGKVVVELDSAALFEKPDGTPHVIGPTSREPGGKATIEGFERFREAIDLRDHFVELRDLNEKSRSVISRSKDGIPVAAIDVRFMFSIYRGDKIPTSDLPYQFDIQAIENIFYKAVSRVTPDQNNPSQYSFHWVNNMIGLIRGELSKFMNQRNLNEYIASIGLPEVERIQQREDTILDEARNVLPVRDSLPEKNKIPPVPEFVPRPQITNLFNQFAQGFANNSRERGVQLQWIGVGTWKPFLDTVHEEHIDAWRAAWRAAREILTQGSREEIMNLRREAVQQRILSLIQEVPLAEYYAALEKHPDQENAMKAILLAFRKILKDQFELLRKNKDLTKPGLLAAIFHIDSLVSHRIYPPPPASETKAEEQLYKRLLDKINDPDVIEKLIHFELETNLEATREELLEKIINEWDRDIKDERVKIVRPEETQVASLEYNFENLVKLVDGNEIAANQLIEYERAQFPNEAQENLVARAINRLIQDRR